MPDVFHDLDNLGVNPQNTWLPYQWIRNDIVEFHDGDWFQNAATSSTLDTSIFDLGIILYTDKTDKGQFINHMGWSLLFSLYLYLKREFVRGLNAGGHWVLYHNSIRVLLP
jgi:hypothetical protein